MLAVAGIFFTSCNNKAATPPTFCDTNCKADSIVYKGDDQFKQSLTVFLSKCSPDTLSWTYGKSLKHHKVQLTELLGKTVKLNQSAVACAFQDTTMVWLTFNDCTAGRGYLVKLGYNNSGIGKISSALNKFDPKFVVDDDLRAYADKGNIFVDNVHTGKEAQMTFKKEYPIDFDHVHDVIDSINVTKQRIYVRLLDDDKKEVILEKKIEL